MTRLPVDLQLTGSIWRGELGEIVGSGGVSDKFDGIHTYL